MVLRDLHLFTIKWNMFWQICIFFFHRTQSRIFYTSRIRREGGGQDGWWVYKIHTLTLEIGVSIHLWFGFGFLFTVNTYAHASSQDRNLFLAYCFEFLNTTIKFYCALGPYFKIRY